MSGMFCDEDLGGEDIDIQGFLYMQDEHYFEQPEADPEEGTLAKDLRACIEEKDDAKRAAMWAKLRIKAARMDAKAKTEREDLLVNRVLAPLTRMLGMLQRIEMHLERLAKK